jgi:hypothetical protein
MIVCMSRRICVDLYRELLRLRPAWHHDADDRFELCPFALEPLLSLDLLAFGRLLKVQVDLWPLTLVER